MTDDEIIQYLDTIKPIYTKEIRTCLTAINDEMKEIETELRWLFFIASRQPPLRL